MKGYERIYVVSDWYLDAYDVLSGGCCEVAYRDLNEAKAKYEEVKSKVIEMYDGVPNVKYVEDEYGEYIEFFEETVNLCQPRTDRKTLSVVKIEYLDLKE